MSADIDQLLEKLREASHAVGLSANYQSHIRRAARMQKECIARGVDQELRKHVIAHGPYCKWGMCSVLNQWVQLVRRYPTTVDLAGDAYDKAYAEVETLEALRRA